MNDIERIVRKNIEYEEENKKLKKEIKNLRTELKWQEHKVDTYRDDISKALVALGVRRRTYRIRKRSKFRWF